MTVVTPHYVHNLGATIFIQKLAVLTVFWTLGQSQLLPVRADGMQVCAVKCRFIRSYCRFEVGAGRN
jgi:hypothetical protein